ncbi:unnamed protein product [Spirodela intermedia]|uniref:Uncharacterized protein n=1 Tax=Spirodela intermedia TaxID=51605 RepID=A0ABN7EBW4_SPIIN|nr:unnamed protein product [Spirodela intermedia]
MEFQEEEMRRSSAEPLAAAAEDQMPAEIDWEMLDKSRFFSSGRLLLRRTRLQISRSAVSCLRAASSILRQEVLAFYRGLATVTHRDHPARAVYMAALEVTKSGVVWTPIDVVSQRLMAQSAGGNRSFLSWRIDATRKILMAEGMRGLYRGIRGGSSGEESVGGGERWVTAVQAASAAVAGSGGRGHHAADTIKTRMQVLGSAAEGGGGKVAPVTVARRWKRCSGKAGGRRATEARPRVASMSMSAITMITTYELVKRLSAKSPSTTLRIACLISLPLSLSLSLSVMHSVNMISPGSGLRRPTENFPRRK